MKTHDLKTWPAPFEAVWQGRKTYEIRKNDRGYEVGDVLVLREYEPSTAVYSGRVVEALVTYMTKGSDWHLPPDLCVLALDVTERYERKVAATTPPAPELPTATCACPMIGGEHKRECPHWLRMNAYYYSFTPTGVLAIDRILSAIAGAGKAYHHTEQWGDDTDWGEGVTGKTPVEWIQNAANDAARSFRPAPASGEATDADPSWAEVVRCVDAFRAVMLEKLKKNQHKGNREGWKGDSPFALLARVRQETDELEADLRVLGEEPIPGNESAIRARLVREAADVANMAMMVADAARALPVTPKEET